VFVAPNQYRLLGAIGFKHGLEADSLTPPKQPMNESGRAAESIAG
jgi:hypothetical protein